MRVKNIFILCFSIVFLFTLISTYSAEAAMTDWIYSGFQCIRHGSVKDCEQSFPVGDFSYQLWQAGVNTFYEGFGSAGSLRVDICLNTSGQMWSGQCVNFVDANYQEVILNPAINTSAQINDLSTNTDLFWYAVLHVRVEDASTNTDVRVYGRKVSIDSFSASPSQVKAGDSINVSWNTDQSFRERTLFYGGVTQPGSRPVDEDGSTTFTAGSAGTADFTLKACGPGAGIPYSCIEQDRTVTITTTPTPTTSPLPTGTIRSNFTTCTKSGSQKCDIVLDYTTSDATQGNINQIYNNGPEVRYYDIPGAVLPAGTAPTVSNPVPGTYVYILFGANASFPSQELNRTSVITINPEEAPPPSGNFSLTVNKSGSGAVTSSPAGINCDPDCSESYNQGASVNLFATPDSGWTFSGWSGDCGVTTSSTLTCTMNSNKVVTATFASTGQPPPSPSPSGCQGNCARYISQVPPPSQMTVGESKVVSITMENIGTTTWTCCSGSSDINFSDGYKLGSQNQQDNFIWGLARDIVSKAVLPGQQETFSFSITAPSTSNTYNFQWRMVQDIGRGWFGDLTPNVAVNVVPSGITTCQDPTATNFGGSLPCIYPPTTCQDPNATNFGGQLPCTYPPGTISITSKEVNTGRPVSTNWTLFYNGSIVNQDSGSSKIYSNKPAGQYGLEVLREGTTHVWDHTEANPASQVLASGGTLTYTVWYRPKSAVTCQDRNATNYGGALPCIYPPGAVTASCTVNVGPPPVPTVSLSASPSTVGWNQSSTLSWSSANADSCSASGDWSGAKNLSGSQSTGNLTQIRTYNYNLICSGAGGQGSASTSVAVNAPPPSVSNVTVTEPNYCLSGPAATTNWSYSDPLASGQSAYQVQIDEQGSFQSPEWDSGKVYCGSCRSNSTPQGYLQFNTTYRARVRAWNGYDIASDWIVSSAWKTPSFAYPQVNFTFNPITPGQTQLIPNDPIQFTDQTVFYDSNPNGRSWSWLFGDGGSSIQQNPRHSYANEGNYSATLTARDNAGQSCSLSKPLNVQKPNPIWKEVNPGG